MNVCSASKARRAARSRCEAALGHRELALAELARSAAGWERWRGMPGDPEWRESRGPEARQLYQQFQELVMAVPAQHVAPVEDRQPRADIPHQVPG